MSEEVLASDDQSHYEVSLTAGQAFLAFVLLLLSLAASFAFGLMIGKGQADERATVRKDATVVNESAARKAVVPETAVVADDFKAEEAEEPAKRPKERSAVITEEPERAAAVAEAEPAAAVAVKKPVPAPAPASEPAPAAARDAVPYYAQLFSTSDQKNAEKMAASLIDGGFLSAYVERGTSDKGPVFRVRVRFNSEAEARAAEAKLRTFSKDVWITKQ